MLQPVPLPRQQRHRRNQHDDDEHCRPRRERRRDTADTDRCSRSSRTRCTGGRRRSGAIPAPRHRRREAYAQSGGWRVPRPPRMIMQAPMRVRIVAGTHANGPGDTNGRRSPRRPMRTSSTPGASSTPLAKRARRAAPHRAYSSAGACAGERVRRPWDDGKERARGLCQVRRERRAQHWAQGPCSTPSRRRR